MKIAAASPAAPAPTITMSSAGIRAVFSSGAWETGRPCRRTADVLRCVVR
jgi:hypothetical protein